METKHARRMAVEEAFKLEAAGSLPTCSGCPDGVFESRIDAWLRKLANILRHRTFLPWEVASIGVPPFAFVLRAEQIASKDNDPPFIEFPIARIEKRGGDRWLAIIDQEAVEAAAPAVDVPEARDRIGELLEGQARIEARLKALEDVSIVRHQHVGRELQRVMMFVNYFGRAPWVGTLTGWFTREITLGRPDGPGAPPK